MTTHDNAPPPEDWQPLPRCCGEFCDDVACRICGRWAVDIPPIPPNIELGTE